MTGAKCFALKLLFVLSSAFSACAAYNSQVVITELFRDPNGSESAIGAGLSHEYIEITNVSQSEFTFDGILITDGGGTDSVIVWKNPIALHSDCVFNSNILHPGQSALILDPDYSAAIESNSSFRLPIAPGTLILTIPKKEIFNGLASDDGALLFKGNRDHIDTLLFYASDENWESSIVPGNKITLSAPTNTEGFSVVLDRFLFGNHSYQVCPGTISPGVFEKINNKWIAEWACQKQNNSDSVLCTIRCIYSGVYQNQILPAFLRNNDFYSIQKDLNVQNGCGEIALNVPINKGDLYFSIGDSIRWLLDDPKLNSCSGIIKISEIYPRGSGFETEWFEITNISRATTVNIQYWSFGNNENSIQITQRKELISPAQFILICKDSLLLTKGYNHRIQPAAWQSMDNYKDTIFIWNDTKEIIDSASYNSQDFDDWKNQSLERTDLNTSGTSSLAWRLSPVATPGMPNEYITNQVTSLKIGPVPFTPDKDGKNDFLQIQLPEGKLAELTIFSFDGKRTKSFSNRFTNIYMWDGLKDNGDYAPIGPFFVVAKMITSKGSRVFKNKGVLWR